MLTLNIKIKIHDTFFFVELAGRVLLLLLASDHHQYLLP